MNLNVNTVRMTLPFCCVLSQLQVNKMTSFDAVRNETPSYESEAASARIGQVIEVPVAGQTFECRDIVVRACGGTLEMILKADQSSGDRGAVVELA